MSQFTYAANLSADDFPLLSGLQGQTVIVGKFDQDYELDSKSSTAKLQKEKRIPQSYYVHNVMPTGLGYQSVGYSEKIAALASVSDFKGAFVLRDISENKTLFSPASGKNYVWDRNIGAWRSINPLIGAESALVTVAYLSGETYIFYEKVGCFKYNKTTQVFDSVTLVGLVPSLINGICSSQGFMLAWDDANNIYRSQAASPLDFTPDQSLGSGAGVPEDIRGKILVLFPIANGYIVYTTANMVSATFQQNIRYPFTYKEISGSSGIASPNHVSWNDNVGEHYAWTLSGLQRVNKSTAAYIYPEVTDFLVSKKFEDYDEATDSFIVTNLASQVNVGVCVVSERFVVISYGLVEPIFTHAIVLDLAFKRFGKLKINHVGCITFASPNLSGDITWDMLGSLNWDDLGDTSWNDLGTQLQTVEMAKETFGFIHEDGQVEVVVFDYTQNNNDGVLVLGKYQLGRERLLTLDSVELENVEVGNNFVFMDLVSLNGKTFDFKNTMALVSNKEQYRKYNALHPYNTGKNHTLVGKGTFHLQSLNLTFHQHGRN